MGQDNITGIESGARANRPTDPSGQSLGADARREILRAQLSVRVTLGVVAGWKEDACGTANDARY